MKFKVFVIAALFLGISCTEALGQAKDQFIHLLKPTLFVKNIKNSNVQLVDIRTPEEFKSGHLEGAINIDFYDQDFIEQMRKRLNTENPVYIYCHSGGRSGRAAKKLRKAGFSEVTDMEGGIVAWKAAKLKLVK